MDLIILNVLFQNVSFKQKFYNTNLPYRLQFFNSCFKIVALVQTDTVYCSTAINKAKQNSVPLKQSNWLVCRDKGTITDTDPPPLYYNKTIEFSTNKQFVFTKICIRR